MLQRAKIRVCPLARFLRLAWEVGVILHLPEVLTGVTKTYRTWASTCTAITTELLKRGTQLSEREKTFLRQWSRRTKPLRVDGLFNVDELPDWDGSRIPFLRSLSKDDCNTLMSLLQYDPHRKSGDRSASPNVDLCGSY